MNRKKGGDGESNSHGKCGWLRGPIPWASLCSHSDELEQEKMDKYMCASQPQTREG